MTDNIPYEREFFLPYSLFELMGDFEILWGVVANAGRMSNLPRKRWEYVRDATSLDWKSSVTLCYRFEFDPNEVVGGSDSFHYPFFISRKLGAK